MPIVFISHTIGIVCHGLDLGSRGRVMTAQWYYTSNNEQRGPVTWAKLRELASIGMLKPSDLVWTDGMDEWVKARQQDGLFDGVESDDDSESRNSRGTETRSSRRARRDEDVEENEESPRRRSVSNRSGGGQMPAALKVLLILGVVFVLIVMIGGCIGGIVWFSTRPGGGGGNRVHDSFTVNNLFPKGDQFRDYRFTRGRRVVITVSNDVQIPQPDVDLYVHRLRDNQLVGADILVPAQNRNCRVEFVVPADDTYRVRVVNLGPGMARRCAVRVDEN